MRLKVGLKGWGVGNYIRKTVLDRYDKKTYTGFTYGRVRLKNALRTGANYK